jgi:hypothetical protein
VREENEVAKRRKREELWKEERKRRGRIKCKLIGVGEQNLIS